MKAGQNAPDGYLDSVGRYLDEIGCFPLLTKQDEQRLGKTITEGREAQRALAKGEKLTAKRKRDLERSVSAGEKATVEFVTANLRLVVSIAKRYQWSGLPLLDLIQDGNIGLTHAVEKFDWSLGFKFSTYATWWIRQAIGRAVENLSRTVRIPSHVGDEVRLIRKFQREIEEETGHRPTISELAEAVGMSAEHITMVLRFDSEPASLDAGIGEEGVTPLSDVVGDPSATDSFATVDSRDEVMRLVSGLKKNELEVVIMRYGLDGNGPRTLDEVGRQLGCTRENVRLTLLNATTKMRERMEAGPRPNEPVAV